MVIKIRVDFRMQLALSGCVSKTLEPPSLSNMKTEKHVIDMGSSGPGPSAQTGICKMGLGPYSSRRKRLQPRLV